MTTFNLSPRQSKLQNACAILAAKYAPAVSFDRDGDELCFEFKLPSGTTVAGRLCDDDRSTEFHLFTQGETYLHSDKSFDRDDLLDEAIEQLEGMLAQLNEG